jgi:hypothetical protein
VALTVGVFRGEQLVADLSQAEEERLNNRVTAVVDTEGTVGGQLAIGLDCRG